MDRIAKIDSIINFVTLHPESTASRTIIHRYYLRQEKYETSQGLGLELKDILQDKDRDEIDFCYYLVK